MRDRTQDQPKAIVHVTIYEDDSIDVRATTTNEMVPTQQEVAAHQALDFVRRFLPAGAA